MISLDDFKKELGHMTQNLSEPEIRKIMQMQDKLADSFFESWLKSLKK